MAKNKFSPAEIQSFLTGVNYPASKEDLVNHARRNRASDDILSMIEGMRSNRFNSPAEVSDSLSS